MNKVCLYGASGHGKVIHSIIKTTINELVCYFDDNESIKSLNHMPVYSPKKIRAYEEYSFLISIGNNKLRKKISKILNVKYTNIIDSRSIVDDDVIIGVGTVVMRGAIVNPHVSIGQHCIINTGAVVEHDCKIDDFVHISPNATITGNVTIGEGTHIGAGATILPNITIGKWAVVGAGAVILENVPDFAVLVGNPGKIIKYNTK